MREARKGTYTLQEIGAKAFATWPARWKNPESAYASVKTIAQRLNIGDINGKKKYKLIAAVDAAQIFDELEKTNTKKRQGSGQADFFALIPGEETAKKVADAFTGPVELTPDTEIPTKPTPEKLKALETAADILKDAVRIFFDCLIDYERGRG